MIRSHLAATVKGFPVYVHTIEHEDGRVLVDTGMIDSTPELDEEWEPVPMPDLVRDTIAAFVAEHHVEEVFVKRKRDRADPESLGRRPPATPRDKR